MIEKLTNSLGAWHISLEFKEALDRIAPTTKDSKGCDEIQELSLDLEVVEVDLHDLMHSSMLIHFTKFPPSILLV